MLLVWVDDIISIATNTTRNDIVEQDLGGKFEIKALGRPKMLLGMGISQNSEITQLNYFKPPMSILSSRNMVFMMPTLFLCP